MNIYNSVTELIGNTPILNAKNFSKINLAGANILVKLECFNPAGSAKDRVALAMIEDAETRGLIKSDTVIIEPTSGNTGIGLASIATARGYKVILTMPDTMSIERRNLLKAYGAEVVLTEGAKGMSGAIEKAQELAKQFDSSFIPSQFDNPANAKAHFNTTGVEVWRDTEGKVDIFVAGIGTGGTITGTGKYLKSKNPNIKIVGVEPFDSQVLTKGVAGPHGIQGIGANFVPSILNREIYDEIMPIKTEDALSMAKSFVRAEGVLVGISSGAALMAAVKLAKRAENKGKNIVALLPDTGERYLSAKGFID
ncbi:MAG: cysteine synthase A [Oscillospiraceae bacterium]|nr:cysteine synthase A [Oscillospiraceae bacterium]